MKGVVSVVVVIVAVLVGRWMLLKEEKEHVSGVESGKAKSIEESGGEKRMDETNAHSVELDQFTRWMIEQGTEVSEGNSVPDDDSVVEW